MKKNIILCGVGGQGTVIASKIISHSAMQKSIPVMSAETIGMAQKGGSVSSHIRLGDDLHTPMIPKGQADVIIAFEPAEALRLLPYLKKNGGIVVNSCATKPVTATLSASDYNGAVIIDYLRTKVNNILILDCNKACAELNNPKAANMVLLGAAIKTGEMPIDLEDVKNAITDLVSEKFYKINEAALKYAWKE